MLVVVQEETMLTVDEVAEQLKVSVMTVRRMIGRGDLQAFKVAGQLRIDETEFAAYLEGQRVKPKPKNANKPARPTDGELRKVGVEWRDSSSGILGCLNCGRGWAVNVLPGGRLPRGYWRCPNGCNSDENLEVSEEVSPLIADAAERREQSDIAAKQAQIDLMKRTGRRLPLTGTSEEEVSE